MSNSVIAIQSVHQRYGGWDSGLTRDVIKSVLHSVPSSAILFFLLNIFSGIMSCSCKTVQIETNV
jgi:hypothetical protein